MLGSIHLKAGLLSTNRRKLQAVHKRCLQQVYEEEERAISDRSLFLVGSGIELLHRYIRNGDLPSLDAMLRERGVEVPADTNPGML